MGPLDDVFFNNPKEKEEFILGVNQSRNDVYLSKPVFDAILRGDYDEEYLDFRDSRAKVSDKDCLFCKERDVLLKTLNDLKSS